MKLFSIVITLLVSAPFVSTAAHPNVVKPGFREIIQLTEIIAEEDNPNLVAGLLGTRRIEANENQELMKLTIAKRHPGCFQALLSRMNFESPADRNIRLTDLLKFAFESRSMGIVELLLADGFKITFWDWKNHFSSDALVAEPWTLDELKRFMTLHSDRAADLAPTFKDMRYVWKKEDALFLIGLAAHCDVESVKLGKPRRFNPTNFLRMCVLPSPLSDEDWAEVALHLLHFGADSKKALNDLAAQRPGYTQTYQVLKEWNEVDIKEPGIE